MFEDLSIPMESVQVTLPTGTLGVFEPVSCAMFLNMADQDFSAWQLGGSPDDPVGLTFAHEVYHYFQTIGTGYLHAQYQSQLHALQKAKTPAKLMRHLMSNYLRRRVRGPIGRMKYFWMPRADREHLSASNEYWGTVLDQLKLEELAVLYGQRNMAGLLHPGLAMDLGTIREPALVRGADGLSAQDVYEGSAVVYALVTAYPHGDADEVIRTSNPQDESPYERMTRRVLDRCGDRPMSGLLLAASALALRFERPGDAFFPILERLLHEPVGSEVDAAREIDLATVTCAGRILGTARDVRASEKAAGRKSDYTDVEWYATPMDRLTSDEWPLDELALLTDPECLGAIPGGQLSFGIVTRDGARAPKGTEGLGFRRMVGCMMLGSGLTIAGVRRELADYFYEYRALLLP